MENSGGDFDAHYPCVELIFHQLVSDSDICHLLVKYEAERLASEIQKVFSLKARALPQ